MHSINNLPTGVIYIYLDLYLSIKMCLWVELAVERLLGLAGANHGQVLTNLVPFIA